MPSLLYNHLPKNLLLILLSFIFLPLDTFLLFSACALRPFLRTSRRENAANVHKDTIINGNGSGGQTILITGVSMTKALVLARLLHAHNPSHRIIGADFHPLACGRMSRSLSCFYVLSPPTTSGDADPYIASLLRIVKAERCALWISCSGVASALEDGIAAEVVAKRTRCRVVQFGVADVRDLHDKNAFMERTRRLGLRVPETRKVESADAMVAALRRCVGLSDWRGEKEGRSSRKFIAKSVGMDDKSRGDLTLLPRSTERETREHVARLGVSSERPWIVQEFVRGREFCTHALVVRGCVRAFLACPSAELLMHYRALSADAPLSRAMLAFTERQAESGGEDFTGHLSFDFLVKHDDIEKTDPESINLYPIECNPRAHTADVLLNGSMELAGEYLAVLQNGQPPRRDIVTPKQPSKYYWIGHDLVQLLLLPVLLMLTGQATVRDTAQSVRDFLVHLLFWKDGTFELWDPLPWWWLYHVYWPMQFVNSIRTGRKWSRMNVSTTKMFDCD
ncbi:O-methyltransferase [Lasiodiplodia theobromae]|uniref:ATP-grasp domain-containing protein n=1 Tax=Lasiodiplodia theobromae TaxID=45133 RepID=A0A5N5D3I3_9PEZI|nr:O-methyltransferase [Lasiodiplodia theobromae]KAB2572240.1 hypothetical protein DBV05_g9070 [Lasiodiplodia theobromae]KAF4536728.1 O-methyltransferase [Lasiodiplodia theobromae]